MAKEFALDHEQDFKAYLLAPWRKKVEENRFASCCGCVFDAEGKGVKLCDDPWLYHELPASLHRHRRPVALAPPAKRLGVVE